MDFHGITMKGFITLPDELISGDEEASLRYNTATRMVEYCNNNGWHGIGKILEGVVGIGGVPGAAVPTLRKCTIDGVGTITNTSDGPDLMLNSTNDNSPDQDIIAYRSWSYGPDLVDFQKLAEDQEIVPGKCYYDDFDGAKVCNKRCQKSVIGIASDTFGIAVGSLVGSNRVPIAVAGWVLAYVDDAYELEPGDVLTNGTDGILVKMSKKEKMEYPERIVAIYKKKEILKKWGLPGKEIKVLGRRWVKVKG